MATKLISQLSEALFAVGDDWIEMEVAATGASRKIKKSNFLSDVLTGDGTITGGGTLATNGYTLTLPASGVPSLLASAQTYTAPKTFAALLTANAGITFGGEVLDVIERGTWTPILTDASSGGNNAVLTTTTCRYARVGPICVVSCHIQGIDTAGMTGTNQAWLLGLPYSANGNWFPNVMLDRVTYSGYPVGYISGPTLRMYNIRSGTFLTGMLVSDIASHSGTIIRFSVAYEVAS